MSSISRRKAIKIIGAAGAAAAFGPLVASRTAMGASARRVVVIGGGFGGATCASYLKRFDPGVDVTLITSDGAFVTCPFSNSVLAGMRKLDFITHGYDGLRQRRQVNVVQDTVTSIDPAGKAVSTAGGKRLGYDRLVVSPGIDFRWDEIDASGPDTTRIMPHAWQAGEQTRLLRKQIESMPDGGVLIIAPPPGPFRAPPAPYERASLIAYYFAQAKPKSKVLIVDSSDEFAKQELFLAAWKKLYPGMIEWIKGSDVGRIVRVNRDTMEIFSSTGRSFKGDVINLIPPQKAGAVALKAGLGNAQGWCPVNQGTFESTLQKDIHVLGDACIAGDMPKTAHAANTQAKVCAAAIVSALNGVRAPDPVYSTSIYSLLSPKYAISMAAVYRLKNGRITTVSGGESPLQASKKTRFKEANYAGGWYKAITADTFAMG